jgi:4'-phosphopantetheinyl transferase EntD
MDVYKQMAVKMFPYLAEKAIKQRAGCLFLLSNAGINPEELTYNDDGKPYLNTTLKKVSFSHSGNYVAMQLSDNFDAGIDIEIRREKVMKVKSKFVGEKEKFAESIEQLSIIWGAKECIYKHWSKRSLLFKEHIVILPFDLGKTGKISAFLFPDTHQTQQLELEYQINDDFCLVYISKVI